MTSHGLNISERAYYTLPFCCASPLTAKLLIVIPIECVWLFATHESTLITGSYKINKWVNVNIQLELVTVVISENMSVRREQSRSVTWSVLIIILVSASKSQSKTFN